MEKNTSFMDWFQVFVQPVDEESYDKRKKQLAFQCERFTWWFPNIGVPPNGWFIMENRIKMNDLEVPLFQEPPHVGWTPHFVITTSQLRRLFDHSIRHTAAVQGLVPAQDK